MKSEYQHNKGAPELECEALIEWAPYKGWPTIETPFEVIYEMDGGCRINGIYLKHDESEHDYTSDFTPEQYSQAEQACIDDYNYRGEREQAGREDAADSMAEIAREMQQEALEMGDRQRGVKL